MTRKTGIWLLLVLLGVGCGDPDPWVARIGNERIRTSELIDSYRAGKPQNVLQRTTPEKLEAHLNRMIDERLMLLEAYRQRLDQDSSIVARLQNEEKKRLYDRVIEQEVVDKVIPESERREFYSRLGVEVRARHIFLEVRPEASEEEQEAVREKLGAIRSQLDQGADFAELVRKYSQDAETVLDGGDLGWITWSPNPIQMAAFELEPGEVSQPVRSRFGWHLVKVEEKRAVRVPPFAQMDRQIKHTLRRFKSEEVNAAGERFVSELMERYHFRFEKDNLARIAVGLAPADSAARKGRRIPIDSLLTPQDLDLPLASYDGATIRARELRIYRRYPTTESQLRSWILRKVRRDLIVAEGYRLGLHKIPEFQEQLRAVREEILRKAIDEREVLAKVEPMPPMPSDTKKLAEINVRAQEIRTQQQQRRAAWLAELRERYPIVIDGGQLRRAAEEIRGSGE